MESSAPWSDGLKLFHLSFAVGEFAENLVSIWRKRGQEISYQRLWAYLEVTYGKDRGCRAERVLFDFTLPTGTKITGQMWTKFMAKFRRACADTPTLMPVKEPNVC